MRWVVTWLLGLPLFFFVIALAVHVGHHADGGWPYLLPLLISGVFLGLLSAGLAYTAQSHGKRPHEVEL